MSDLLAVVGDEITDEDLLTEIARQRPDRVTVLAEEESDEDRVASLVDATVGTRVRFSLPVATKTTA